MAPHWMETIASTLAGMVSGPTRLKWTFRLLGPPLGAFLILLILHPFAPRLSSRGAVEEPAPAAEPMAPPDHVVRALIEADEVFSRNMKVRVPKVIPDRKEVQEMYPAIAVLQALEYAVVKRAVADNSYERRITMQSRGRVVLAEALREDRDSFIIDIARPQLTRPGRSRPAEGETLLVSFRWRWEPLNELGAALDLTGNGTREMRGEAELARKDGEWLLVELRRHDTAPRYDGP